MSAPAPLATQRLHATYDPSRIPWEDSRAINYSRLLKKGKSPFQPRAMQALDLALQIREAGYNVYVAGPPDLGRSYMTLSYLRPRAALLPSSPDLLYVRNFADPDSPLLLKLPAGKGKIFKESIVAFLRNINQELARRMDTMSYVRKRAVLADRFQALRLKLLRKMKNMAEDRGFVLEVDEEGGMALAPARTEAANAGEPAGAPALQEPKGDGLAQSMATLMHRLSKAEESFHEDEKVMERQAVQDVLGSLYRPLRQKLLKVCGEEVGPYLDSLINDMLENAEAFLSDETRASVDAMSSGNFFRRYEINLFVDNSGMAGAPVIVEDNPTPVNLLGCMERESEMGALVTDFTLIRSGSLQRANGGFLILHIADLLQHPMAFEGLLRALRSAQARIEDSQEAADGTMRTKSLRPQPLDLDLKVILIGDDEIYETLLYNDDRFAKLFRIKAQMTDLCERSQANIKVYLAQLAVIIAEASLTHFDRTALAWLVDLGSHLGEDQKKLSLRFPVLRELMIEGDALARMRGQSMVTGEIMEDAYSARAYRVNLVEDEYMEDYDREMIKLRTNGSAIGQVNGLSVTMVGDFEFGLPHRISCTVGVGHDGIIDLEREAELGGPIHTKAMMILKSYLTDLFARKKPLVLSASLHFEQSYAGIEGDSASGAELAALLSALAEVPMRLELAFTGAVGQSGQIMAVGGVSRKIEGFYKVCSRQGLTGSQGVIIPYDNVDHLMLSNDILESAAQGKFAIYPVKRIEEALFLLSGIPAGKRLKNGGFTRGSLYDLADRRLVRLGCYAQGSFRKPRNE